MDEQPNALAPVRNDKGQFILGHTGMGGRPVGARTKLGEAFIEALHNDFTEHGVGAIQKVRDEKPDQYLKVIASLLPKDVNLNFNNEIEMSDDELCERIRALGETIAPFLADRAGAADQRVEAEGSKAIAPRVH
jgi:hypothetical protein